MVFYLLPEVMKFLRQKRGHIAYRRLDCTPSWPHPSVIDISV